MGNNISPQRAAFQQRIYELWDQDHSGVIDVAELNEWRQDQIFLEAKIRMDGDAATDGKSFDDSGRTMAQSKARREYVHLFHSTSPI